MKDDTSRTNPSDPLRNVQANHLSWLWLAIGFLLLPFTMVQTVIPLAAWLAPTFLLRFARTSRRARTALPSIFIAYAIGVLIATRGAESGSIQLLIVGIVVFPLIRGLMYTLPYAADRWIGARLGPWARVLVFPLAFTAVDWVMSLGKIVNSTGSPAYSQYSNLALLQILSITGMVLSESLRQYYRRPCSLAVCGWPFSRHPRRALQRQRSPLTIPSINKRTVALTG
jgi:hypothetical protein